MTVDAFALPVQYSTNGTTGPWTVPFYFLTDGDLVVVYTDSAGVDTTLALTVGYTVTGAGTGSGTVTTTTAYATGGTLTIDLDITIDQQTDYVETDAFPAETHERALDKLTLICKQLARGFARSLMLPISSALSSLTFPPPGAGKYIRWNLLGTALEAVDAVYDLGNFLASLTGAVSRTAISKMGDIVSVVDFGASPGASAAVNATAFQQALNALGAAGGGKLLIPRGNYSIGAELVVDYENLHMQGDGASGQHLTFSGTTVLTATHTSGSVIRIKKPDCGVSHMVLAADSTRQAAAATSANHGIRVEADDNLLSTSVTKRTHIHNVRMTKQPAAGLVLIGDIIASQIEMVDVDQCGSHAFVINGGPFTSRANPQRPGQTQLLNCRATRNGGHALLIGDDSDNPQERVYRIIIDNFEEFYNCRNNALKLADFSWYIHGENIMIEGSATDGSTDLATPDHGGIRLSGQNITIRNHRFVQCDVYCARVYARIQSGGPFRTREILFEYLSINNTNPGTYNPAILVESTCYSVKARYSGGSTDVASLISTDSINFESESYEFRRFDGVEVGGNFKSVAATAILDDDKAGYWTFNTVAYGLAIISGNVLDGGYATVWFRVGDADVHCNLISSAGTPTVTCTTGTLANGGGVDGRLTIAADSATNRLYISNRTGGSTRGYQITMLSGIGWAREFVNL